MKRMLLTLSAIALLAGLNGCCWPRCLAGGEGCGGAGCEACGDAGYETCGDPGCGTCGGPKAGCGLLSRFRCGGRAEEAFTPGPPTGAITYPYYTNRGPRDFLAENPPSIGP